MNEKQLHRKLLAIERREIRKLKREIIIIESTLTEKKKLLAEFEQHYKEDNAKLK